MKFRIKHADKIVGLFILLSILGMVSIVIILGVNQRWFSKNYFYYSRFKSATGLSRGMIITFKGFEIGKVDNFDLNDDNEVDVDFYIYEKYHEIVNVNSILELAASPLGSALLFHPGKAGSMPLPEGEYVPSLASEEGKRLLEMGLVEMPEKSEETISSILTNVDEIVYSFNEFMKNNLDDIENSVVALNDIIVSLDLALKGQGAGTINDLVQQARQISYDLSITTRNIALLTQNPDGLVPRLLGSKGSIGTIFNDNNSLYNSIQQILYDLEETAESLKEFSKYMSGTTTEITGFLKTGQEALAEGTKVLEGLKNSPLLSGGITKEREQPTTAKSFRDEEF